MSETLTSGDWNCPTLGARKAAIPGMFPNSLLLGYLVRHVVHPSEMRKRVVEMQLLHASGDLGDDRRTGGE